MRRFIQLIAMSLAVALSSGPGSALADPAGPVWDSRGWVHIGERTVKGPSGHDRIEVRRYEGGLTRLTIAVQYSDLEMLDLKIVFSDHTEHHPALTHQFREGRRIRAIDLPPTTAVD